MRYVPVGGRFKEGGGVNGKGVMRGIKLKEENRKRKISR